MTMNRRNAGFLLNEMLLNLVLISLVLLVSVEPLRTVIYDLHQTHQDYQTRCTAGDMLKTLRRDIQRSRRMAIYESDTRLGGNLLYLEQENCIFVYQLTDGIVCRTSVSAQPGPDQEWRMPRLRIDWKPWADGDGRFLALEITTRIERDEPGKRKQFMRKAEVLFLNTDPAGERL
jgi:type II secretory pathway component PulJ